MEFLVEKKNELDIGSLIQFNEKAEADAITYYNDFLEAVRKSDLSKIKKERIESEIYEIIGDELNHQERLKSLYSLVTNIKENKD